MSVEELLSGLEYLNSEIAKQIVLMWNYPLFSTAWDFEHSILECLLMEKLSIQQLIT